MNQELQRINMIDATLNEVQGSTKLGENLSFMDVDSSTSNSPNSFQHPASATTSRTASVGSEGDKTEKLLKTLQFRNPGPQLSGFNPDRSRREQRKVNQFVQKAQILQKREKRKQGEGEGVGKRRRKQAKRHTYHDRSGVRLLDGKDVCDCQDLNCPGCHFPCSSCGSEKCGVECRCSRKWTYETTVEVENPYSYSKEQALHS